MRWLIGAAVVATMAACGDGASSDAARSAVTSATISYGDAPEQFGVLSVPPGEGPHPVVVFIHGGFWRNTFSLDLAEPQAADAVGAGFAAWNVEYRRVGDPGGGYPGTLDDIAAAIDSLAGLAEEYHLDLDQVGVVGHSAGGHLALWAGQRPDPAVTPRLVVGQAPVADLRNALDLGGGAVAEFMGGEPDDLAAAYATANPAELLGVRVPQLIVHGGDDTIVPVDRSRAYETLVDDPDHLDVIVYDGADHFAVINPGHESWAAVISRLSDR